MRVALHRQHPPRRGEGLDRVQLPRTQTERDKRGTTDVNIIPRHPEQEEESTTNI